MEPITEEGGIIQEWAPETGLLQQIPLRVQKGLFSKYLNLTCVDVVPEFIALGTNCGLIYWYCRAANEMQRLRFESSSCTITCVKIASTIDYMVAGGTDQGNITIFQIPKTLPETLPTNLKSKKNHVERFTINGLHTSPVTCIEWSQNGMKLFSGDKSGIVVLTEIDFYMHISKSMELLNEQFEIVQLKYSQQILLISTTFRSIICDGHDKWKVHQVGTKEKKILGKFGATFFKFDNELVIYVSRPGHRLWLATTNGSVQKTLLFKSAVSSSHPKIQLINPVNKIQSCDTNFGKLIQFGCNKLIAYNSEKMYVLHPNTISTVTSLDSVRKIIDLSVNDDEIFILEGERSLLRLGYAPNKFCTDAIAEESSRRMSFIFDDIASKLKDTALESFKKITSELVITPEPTSPVSPPVLADEALDLPPIINLPPGSISALVPEENVEIHFSVEVDDRNICATSKFNNDTRLNYFTRKNEEGSVNANESNEILSRPLRRRSSKKYKASSNVRAGQELESDAISNASDDRLTASQINEMSASDESSISFSQSQSSFSILRDIPTLLTANNPKASTSELLYDGASKNVDNNSQISLDTCESVSENLKLTPEKFLEEQERTFFRLANQEMSALDKYSSEKTDNMSVSLNMTPSSSISSKISDSGQWISEISENISMVSETKTESSQNDFLPLPKQLCFYNPCSDAKGNNFDEESKPSGSACTSLLCDTCHEISDTDNISSTAILSAEVEIEKIGELNYENETAIEKHVRTNILQGNTPKMDLKMLNIKQFLITECMLQKFKKQRSKFNDTEVQEIPPELNADLALEEENSTSTENEGPDKPEAEELLAQNLEEQSDHWFQCVAPGPVSSLAVSSNYVVCIDSEKKVYFSKLSGLSLSWNSLTYKASSISLSNDASAVWILNKKTLFSLVNPAEKGLSEDEMLERKSNVKSVALDNEYPEGWIVTTDGQVSRQRNLGRIYGEAEQIPCEWLITNIACWNRVVLAITSEGTLVCKSQNEEKFRTIASPKPVINCIALGPDHLAWVVDNSNNIYFSDDFLNEVPQWWQVIISDYMFDTKSSIRKYSLIKLKSYDVSEAEKRTMIASNENSVWVFDQLSTTLKVNKAAVTGYAWDEIPLSLPSVRWQFVCANSAVVKGGQLWLQSDCGDLFILTSNSKNSQILKSLPVPCQDIRCISSSVGVLWLLSAEGYIYVRLGLSSKCSVGSSWKELNVTETDKLQLAWISCGNAIAWGCNNLGKIWATTESPCHISTKLFDLKWVPVEGQTEEGVSFSKVFAGPDFCMVWAIDNRQNIYVREGISHHAQTGTNWILVTGLKASLITISKTSVWALSPNGSVYRRFGVTETNYMGDYWKQIPGTFASVTCTSSDELWGIDENNRILKLRRKTKIFASKKASDNEENLDTASLNGIENEWEMPASFNWP